MSKVRVYSFKCFYGGGGGGGCCKLFEPHSHGPPQKSHLPYQIRVFRSRIFPPGCTWKSSYRMRTLFFSGSDVDLDRTFHLFVNGSGSRPSFYPNLDPGKTKWILLKNGYYKFCKIKEVLFYFLTMLIFNLSVE